MDSFIHVIHTIQRAPQDLVESMKTFSTATICEAYGGKGALFHTIKPIRSPMKLCGPVIPVMTRPGDNLIVHKAIYVADCHALRPENHVVQGFGPTMTGKEIECVCMNKT